MKKLISICLSSIFFLAVFRPLTGAAEEQGLKLAEQSRAALLMERDTGTILFEKNSHEALPPASMTKVMSLLLIMEALDEGKLKLNEKVRTSEYAASMGGSQIFLEAGEEMTVDELIRAIAVASANDATVALAERIAGSEENFVRMMNEKAKELGLKNTRFQNSTGLPAENHYASAYDMAVMAKELLKHENITKYTGIYESYLRENTDKKFWLVNTNRLIRFYPGVDGLKTGYTSEAKYCLTATAKKGNMRVIAVIFGAPTTKERNKQITQMLDYAFYQYEKKTFLAKNAPVDQVTVERGERRKIPAVTAGELSVLHKKGEKLEGVSRVVKIKDRLKAPIKKGDPVGEVALVKDGRVLSKSPLIAGENTGKASFWTTFQRMMGQFTKLQN
ncbi:D-alanyl-D-alanine carboxypeptidase family protein [Caldibacillus debilis]|jgi:D-alanyl-D-alanine carboxypeptidase (penicillin-binding protein 5/6)|uniref:serine-type D-Ala-D-Ala carboxypeptidase n=1 Tax=Caldibacillus debilis TaxID=301148 RepID=A0A150M6N2_9BACI|nr:D-alanyl-D-alanine carboxypeptidase family protein [Caldibacillus debilis]KYD20188.1 D-alanyl-D-alanine carboxypeptidase [Caldibacillus debilis]